MRGIDLERRRIDGLRSRLLGGRNSILVIVGALAIAAIVLALLLRSGPSSTDAKPAAAIPTVVPAATMVPVIVTIPPAATAVPATAPTGERIHTVATGDTLSSIASKYYGDASKWNKIAEANKDVLKDPNSLQLGQKLKIPD